MSKLCPVCRGLMTRRSRGDTCSWPCGMEWRNMKADEKSRRLDLAAGSPDSTNDTPKELSNELRKALFPEVMDSKTQLDKIFGKKEGDK